MDLKSAGNTGGCAGGFFSVKSISGVLRPCISTIIPKENGEVGILLDVGQMQIVNQTYCISLEF